MGLLQGHSNGYDSGLENGLPLGFDAGLLQGFSTSESTIVYPFQKETQDWLNVLTVGVDGHVVRAVNCFIYECKIKGIWKNMLRFWLFAQNDRTNAYKSIANPTSTVPTDSGTITFTPMKGINGTGSPSYVDTNANMSTVFADSTKGAIMGCYINSGVANSDMCEMSNGDNISRNTWLYCQYSPNVAYVALGSLNAGPDLSAGTVVGHTYGYRPPQPAGYSPNLIVCSKNGSSTISATAFVGFYNSNLKLFCREQVALRFAFSTRVMSMAYIGYGDFDHNVYSFIVKRFAMRLGLNG
jgi:hypothetical protein